MAQVAIREYDAKKLFEKFSWIPYKGTLIKNTHDIEEFVASTDSDKKFVIKPDELFGKRGKYGLVGVGLTPQKLQDWYTEKTQSQVTIEKNSWYLSTFLIEPFIAHTDEYYVSVKTEREYDVLYFSKEGWMEIEANWESVREIHLDPTASTESITTSIQALTEEAKIQKFLILFYAFFREYGFSYLEVNPFTFSEDWELICLDMVAKVDSCEAFRQKNNWGTLSFPKPFGNTKSESELYIEKLDSETGASLKFTLLNPHGRIWLLTSGGWASVIIADTIAEMGYASEIANYGECSWNPDRENTREYTKVLIENLLANKKHHQYIIIAGAIANFTHIDKTFSGIIDALTIYAEALRNNNTTILVRRGGINDKKWLKIIKEACEELRIPCHIADGNSYMTDILEILKDSLWNEL